MSVKLLTEHNLEFLSLKGDCTGLSESTLVKIPHCWKSHVTAHIQPYDHTAHITFQSSIPSLENIEELDQLSSNIATFFICIHDVSLLRPEFFYKLIYRPSFCIFSGRRKIYSKIISLFYLPALNIICFVEKKYDIFVVPPVYFLE